MINFGLCGWPWFICGGVYSRVLASRRINNISNGANENFGSFFIYIRSITNRSAHLTSVWEEIRFWLFMFIFFHFFSSTFENRTHINPVRTQRETQNCFPFSKNCIASEERVEKEIHISKLWSKQTHAEQRINLRRHECWMVALRTMCCMINDLYIKKLSKHRPAAMITSFFF